MAAGLLAGVAAIPVTPAAAAPAGFDVGIIDPLEPAFGERDGGGAYDAARDANVRLVRIPVSWRDVAPLRPSNPLAHGDPGYLWGSLDERVRNIASRGMQPLLSLYVAPDWARSSSSYGTSRSTPNVQDFADFAAAISQRYSGATAGVARVRHWQIWNEPNLSTYLDQRDSVEQYRAMVNAAYPAIRAAASGNVVVAGGTAPYAASKGDIAPLRFMRELLCMSGGSKPKPTCDSTISFDVWSHHPYTTGGPNHSAAARDDASLGDLPEMRRLLRAAERAGHVKGSGRARFWATEFSWDTKGPDPGGVPLARHARWVAEAFYNMWRSDVSVCVWFQLRDNPRGTFTWGQTFQSGLFFRTTERYAGERAKPFRAVIRFPFVALPRRGGATVWGRTPSPGRRTVVVERLRGKRWVRFASVKTNASGLFRRSLAGGTGALLRARAGSERAVPFRVERTKDVRVNPFGGDVR